MARVRCTHGGPEVASPTSIDMSVAYDRTSRRRLWLTSDASCASIYSVCAGAGRPAFNQRDVADVAAGGLSVCVPPAFFFLALS